MECSEIGSEPRSIECYEIGSEPRSMECSEIGSERWIVASIDFGTTSSGYAFATISNLKMDPLNIRVSTWTPSSRTLLSFKTPTCILFDPEQEFHSFGREAEDKYTELAQDDCHTNWYYFRRFKMQMYTRQELPRDLQLKDDQGKQMQAMKVIGESIRYLKDHMIGKVEDVKSSEINWVLTVPAIWNNADKQFMKEAAVKGGISNDQLILALEPEAASIFCKHIQSEKMAMVDNEGTATLDAFSAGTKYLILDAGGSTIDITVQEVQNDESIKQLYVANDGACGGTKVDEAFEDLLQEILGKETIRRFHADDKEGHLDLLREFESKKRNITPDQTSKVTFRVPMSLTEAYRSENGRELSRSVLKSKGIDWIGDRFRVDPGTAKDFFTSTCQHIIEHLSKIFDNPKVIGTNTILMVGGFSESPMLRAAIKMAFPKKKIIVPGEAGLAVLKGAVQFGFIPRTISTRISKFTYGVKTSIAFEAGIDPEDKKIIQEESVLCSDRFDKHVEKNQAIGVDEKGVEQVYVPVRSDQISVSIQIYTSDNKNPRYTFEPDCVYLGELTIRLSDKSNGKERKVGVTFFYGKTEIVVRAVDKVTGEFCEAHLDLLSIQK